MRYLSQAGLTKGMLLARNLFDERCNKNFVDGQKLSNRDIEKIKKAGYPGAYILDPCTDKIVADPIINEGLYYGTVSSVAQIMANVRDDSTLSYCVPRREQLDIVEPVLEALMEREGARIDYLDTRPYAAYEDFHAVMAMILALRIGMRLGLTREQLLDLGIASLFHDVGSVFLPGSLLSRPGKLTDEEFEMVKEHVQRGAEYLERNFALTPSMTQGVLQHHENYDGTGYPNGLRRKKISLFGRIIAICDVYDALTSKRAFRAAMYPVAALDVLEQQSDRKFDPDIVDALQNIVAPYPTACLVRLKSGEFGVVAHNYPQDPTKPLLQAYDGKRPQTTFYDLLNDPAFSNARIVKFVDELT
ncbi:MAG: HD-GYP domain-containing protein [Coriobacteriales bacterium]|jgi:HD-GYP domain-containing protein (c-di-GMP phosphodiesterase class II)|nr:HD-GYP domain-containing protein [Coriobacteriales bacterium]